jgi:hypothetical protein
MSGTQTAVAAKTSPSAISASLALPLQRKCACGASSNLAGSCSDCETKKLIGEPLQAKLRVNEPGDEYEQEADRVAEQVMRLPDVPLDPETTASRAAALVQRQVRGKTAGNQTAPPIIRNLLSSPGKPLDAATRAFFEPRFGYDFGNVRVHSGPAAYRSVRDVSANAYAIGCDIAFGEGQFAPESQVGMRLIAHELAHVVQAVGENGTDTRQSYANSSSPVALQRRAETALVLRSVTDESAGFQVEWKAKTREERQRSLDAAPGYKDIPKYEDIKKSGYQTLIELARNARVSSVNLLREKAMNLPVQLQPAALDLVDVVDVDLQAIIDWLFLDLGVVVGFGEGVIDAMIGLLKLAYAIVDFCFDWLIYEFGYLEPFEEDWTQLSFAIDNLLHLDLIGILEAWYTKLYDAPQEQKAIMIGEASGEVLAFLVTWEESATRIGKLRIPPLPPAASEGVPMFAGAGGGGTMAAQAAEAGVKVRVGGPIGGVGFAVASMAGRGRGDETEEIPEEEPTTEEVAPVGPTVPTEEAPIQEDLDPIPRGKVFPNIIQVEWPYIYAGRRLGIVRTVNGNQGWYIRSGLGGDPLPGEPGADDPAPMFGFGIFEPIDEAEAAKLGSRPKKWKWMIKPEGGRTGDAQVSIFLHFNRPISEVTRITILRTADESDLVFLNDWLRNNNVELGTANLQDGTQRLVNWKGTGIWVQAKFRIP